MCVCVCVRARIHFELQNTHLYRPLNLALSLSPCPPDIHEVSYTLAANFSLILNQHYHNRFSCLRAFESTEFTFRKEILKVKEGAGPSVLIEENCGKQGGSGLIDVQTTLNSFRQVFHTITNYDMLNKCKISVLLSASHEGNLETVLTRAGHPTLILLSLGI